jgi:hypothetical protein
LNRIETMTEASYGIHEADFSIKKSGLLGSDGERSWGAGREWESLARLSLWIESSLLARQREEVSPSLLSDKPEEVKHKIA